MKPPLPWIAAGVLVLFLIVRVRGYDVTADPVGWLLMLYGVSRLPFEPTSRTALLGTGAISAAIALFLWLPAGTDALLAADPALAWAAELPRFAFVALLAHGLARFAAAAHDDEAAVWWRIDLAAAVLAGALPALWLGVDLDWLAVPAGLCAIGTLVLTGVLAVAHHRRGWAQLPRPGPGDAAE